MTRKLLVAVAVVMTLFFGVLAQQADASPCPLHEANDCADAEKYPGSFTNHPAAPVGPYGAAMPNVAAPAPAPAPATGGGDSAAPLVSTGSESQILAYFGTGLIAFGAVAMGSRRKFIEGAND